MMDKVSGGCACGAIRYETSSKPGFSFHCHCRDCQRATGGGHASAFVIDVENATIKGDIRYFDTKADSGNIVSRGFCPKCGSPVLNRNSGFPNSLYFHAATLDDPANFEPRAVVYGDSAQPWDLADPKL